MPDDHTRLLETIRTAHPLGPVPVREELERHVGDRIAAVGQRQAQAEYAYVQKLAAERWGAERTAHLASAWRAVAVRPKAPRVSPWERAERAASHLPPGWSAAVQARKRASRATGDRRINGEAWSAAYTLGIVAALTRWIDHARDAGLAPVPDGSALHAYAQWLTDPARGTDAISVRGAADYIARIHAGLGLVEPGSASPGRCFVVRDWRERANMLGSPTKTGAQLVGAWTLFDLGMSVMDEARGHPLRGVDAARLFRNGLMLATAVALPQRARALSCLAFDSSVLLRESAVEIVIPASHLKLPEAGKAGEPFRRILDHAGLTRSMREYRAEFRPVFDGGPALFPSTKSPGAAIGEKRIGQICGELTEDRLGVWIPVHRFRDNVATDAGEALPGGGLASAVLLDHKDVLTTARHYDHGDGVRAMRDLHRYLDGRRGPAVDLDL